MKRKLSHNLIMMHKNKKEGIQDKIKPCEKKFNVYEKAGNQNASSISKWIHLLK